MHKFLYFNRIDAWSLALVSFIVAASWTGQKGCNQGRQLTHTLEINCEQVASLSMFF